MKLKNAARVFDCPLWLLLLVWLLIGRRPAAELSEDEALSLYMVLDDLYYALPVPATRFERLAVPRAIVWIRARQAELAEQSGGVGMIGVLAN